MSEIQTIGIIMDGNRRWAKERGLPAWEGHRVGAERLKDLVHWARERGGISHLFFYAFSTENWGRDPKEIDYLFKLVEELFTSYTAEAEKENTRIRIVGQRKRFPPSLQRIFNDVELRTEHNTGITVWFGLSYGGRAEIVEAVNRALAAKAEVTEEDFKKHLWTAEMPDADIIIRTGGERRLSGFLTWASVYSELFFSETAWPGFTKEEFFSILDEYQSRERRMGK